MALADVIELWNYVSKALQLLAAGPEAGKTSGVRWVYDSGNVAAGQQVARGRYGAVPGEWGRLGCRGAGVNAGCGCAGVAGVSCALAPVYPTPARNASLRSATLTARS